MDLRRIIKLGGCAAINDGQLGTDPVGFAITCIIATVGVTTTISELYPAIPYAYTLVAAMSTPFIINIYQTIITKASVLGSDWLIVNIVPSLSLSVGSPDVYM